ncbi:MAG: serine/threonine-protein kinase [Victivallaceae bacterium]|nr:serine/threonine-protein kinase [Victivallaceae bacterium]
MNADGENDLNDRIEAYLELLRAGKNPTVEEYVRGADPEHRSELRELLEAMLAVEGLSPETQFLSSTSASAAVKFPTELGGEFRLLSKIGQGGMGTVFEALQLSLNRHVAVKILSPFFGSDPKLRQAFRNESKLVASLHHTNIVEVFGAGEDGEYLFYVMELIDGRGMDQHGGALGEREVANLGAQAARALAYAHRHGVLHRDVKPSNLLLDSGNVLHIGDFGLATVLRNDLALSHVTRVNGGTLRYMAPESLLREAYSEATDQYSLGVTLYELLAGRPAVEGSSPGRILKAVCEKGLPPLVGVSAELAAIVDRAMAYLPGDRYPDMEQMAMDLERFLAYEPVAARRSSCWKKLRLWAVRQPAVAALTGSVIVLLSAFCVTFGIGYFKLSDALRRETGQRLLAQNNAAIADGALAHVFEKASALPLSRENARLLAELMPYYEKIAMQRDLPEAKIAGANRMIGLIALRTGNNDLAERSFRKALSHFPRGEEAGRAFLRNKLGEAIHRAGRPVPASVIWKETAECAGRKGASRGIRLEGLRALRNLADFAGARNAGTAYRIASALYREDPGDPNCRWFLALALDDNPKLDRGRKSGDLLAELAVEFPDSPEYKLACVKSFVRDCARTKNRKVYSAEKLEFVQKQATELLTRWPNEPGVLEAIASYRQRYATILRLQGSSAEAWRENMFTLGILKILANTPEAADSDLIRLFLVKSQLGQLDRAVKQQKFEEAERLVRSISDDLARYHGKDLPALLTTLHALFEKIPEKNFEKNPQTL